jgi:hypothetical protein
MRFLPSAEVAPARHRLSLGGLRRRIEVSLLPDEPVIQLRLERAARQERDQRRREGTVGRKRLWPRWPCRVYQLVYCRASMVRPARWAR